MVKYFLISLVFSLLLTLPPLFLDAYGYDDTGKACWYNRKYDQILIGNGYKILISPWKWGTFYIPVILNIAYSTYASVRVMIRLLTGRRLLREAAMKQPRHSSEREVKNQKIIRYLVSRLVCAKYRSLF